MAELKWLSRLLLGTVFIISGVAKFVYWTRFRDTLGAMEILPRWLTGRVSVALPLLEILLGFLVFVGWRLSVSGPLLLSLLVCFLLVLVLYRLRGGKELICGCFADFEHKTPTSSLILRNILLVVSGFPLLIPWDQSVVKRGLVEWMMASTVVLGVLLVWSLSSRLAETVALLRAESDVEDD